MGNQLGSVTCRTCGNPIDPDSQLLDEEICKNCKQDNVEAREAYHTWR